MEKHHITYRTEGSAALKVEAPQQEAHIIAFESLQNSHSKSFAPQPFSKRIANRISSDPLLGSIKNASASSYNPSAEDKRLFLRAAVLISLFSFVVILIGA